MQRRDWCTITVHSEYTTFIKNTVVLGSCLNVKTNVCLHHCTISCGKKYSAALFLISLGTKFGCSHIVLFFRFDYIYL